MPKRKSKAAPRRKPNHYWLSLGFNLKKTKKRGGLIRKTVAIHTTGTTLLRAISAAERKVRKRDRTVAALVYVVAHVPL